MQQGFHNIPRLASQTWEGMSLFIASETNPQAQTLGRKTITRDPKIIHSGRAPNSETTTVVPNP